MEENSNVSDGENANDPNNIDVEQEHNANAKRLKTDTSEHSDEENNCEPGTSSNDNCNTSRNTRTRNYRKPTADDESSNAESANEDVGFREPSVDLEESYASDNSQMSHISPISPTDYNVHEYNDESDEEHPVLRKAKPKHNWFIVPEVVNRQLGFSAKKQSSQLFQRRCYGSLHCVQRLELIYKLEKHEGCVNSLNFHPNGELLASGSDDLKVVLWDWKNGNELLSYDTKHRGNVFQSKFLPLTGDLHIVTCARDGQVRYAQVSAQEGLRSVRKLGSHVGPCHKVAVLQDQPQVVISVGEDGFILRHDLRVEKPDRMLCVKNDEHKVALYSVSGHPLNGNEFCVAGRDYMVRSYDHRRCSNTHLLKSYHPFKKFTQKNRSLHVTCAVYNHNGSEILASYNDADIYLFDVNSNTHEFIHQYQGHRNGATIKGVNFFGPKSEYIISGSDCGNIFFWERDTEAIVQWLFADDSGVVNCLEPHPQLPFLCTSGLDWDVKVWVPSFEQEPALVGLSKAVKNNIKARALGPMTSDLDDTQILWMLWRQLSGNDQLRRVFHFAMENSNLDAITDNSSSSSSSSEHEHTSEPESDDNNDDPTGCTTS
ncbi:PREDICTED: DDB1- and CUL4-associated factor 8 isoform X2 [Nicrophorus vespilloides]|uniref:DDB1- and CUL4-associated factor 8 isoform X2 n=1 Tax=Nicrophorus vespilloides TaxID=110193 RepID=A0ABM1M2A1_NICVS|nr:PREDICTED: DDB1- and CUL4-associated factor 8 isoform X2 [Nicrophorus vespilloides]